MGKNPEHLVIGPNSEHLDEIIHNWRDRDGWHFSAGSPEYWKFSDQMLRPEGRLLDIGIGHGGSSAYFALHGMEVVGLDTDTDRVRSINELSHELGGVLPSFCLTAIESDAVRDPFPESEFDTVVISHVVHMPSRADVYELIDKSMTALKPGGHIWIRAAGTHSSEYERFSGGADDEYEPEVWRDEHDHNVIWHPCSCSGEWRTDSTVFFDPLDILNHVSRAGGRPVHSQTIATEGKMNIMFGEDFRPDATHLRGGMITLLAQKP